MAVSTGSHWPEKSAEAAGPYLREKEVRNLASEPRWQRWVRAVWEDKGTILPVSMLNGEYGQHGVYASVPAVLGRKGVKEVVELKLTEEEKEKFGESCRIMRENFELAVT